MRCCTSTWRTSAGLVAGGVLPSPVPHADLVTFTTYKTMLGPARRRDPGSRRSGPEPSIARSSRAPRARPTSGGSRPRPSASASRRRAVPRDPAAIVDDAAALAEALAERGDRIVSGGTDTHQVLVDLRGRGLTGDVAEVALEDAGILTNRNLIPFDPGTPDRPSGLRLGTTSVAQRGLRAGRHGAAARRLGSTRTLRAACLGVGCPAMARRPPPADPWPSARSAERVAGRWPPSGIRKFFEIVATMTDVISLGIGEPDFDTPRSIIEAGVESLREGRTHYTSNYGTLELRKALAAHLERLYGVVVRPEATSCSSPSARPRRVDLALRATCDPGDEVILHEPSYVAYVPAIVFAGGTAVHVRDALRGRLRARSGRGRGGDHAADQGAVPRLPVQPDRRGPADGASRRSWRGSPSATTCSSTATRSTTASRTARTATGRSRRCRACASGRS